MTTATTTKTAASPLSAILFTAMLGTGLVFMLGVAQSQTLHDAAHDMRHATGFACH
ncbi:MAG: CbtB domain-containing protein [Pseudomonadota bacterium]